jgi:hypothetical protein
MINVRCGVTHAAPKMCIHEMSYYRCGISHEVGEISRYEYDVSNNSCDISYTCEFWVSNDAYEAGLTFHV